MNTTSPAIGPDALKKRLGPCGTTLAHCEVVKKTITYREITVAIGIVVAMVIVLTLWIKNPGNDTSNSDERPRFELRFSAKGLVDVSDFF